MIIIISLFLLLNDLVLLISVNLFQLHLSHLLVNLLQFFKVIILILLLFSALQLVVNLPGKSVLMTIPQEVRLCQTALHSAYRLQPSPVLFHLFVIFEKCFFEIIKLLQLLRISTDRRVRKLKIRILLELPLDFIILNYLFLFLHFLIILLASSLAPNTLRSSRPLRFGLNLKQIIFLVFFILFFFLLDGSEQLI